MVAEPLALALPDLAQAWLLTYLLHSTLLLGGAWLVVALLRRLAVVHREVLWRTALLGGFVTASLQVTLGYESVGGRVAVPPAVPAIETAAIEPVAEPAIATPAAPTGTHAAGVVPPAPPAPSVDATSTRVGTGTPWPFLSLPVALALLWSAGVLFAVLRLARTRRRLHARMLDREPLEAGPLRAALDALADRAALRRPVRLTRAAAIASPVAIGIRRPEICLPGRVTELTSSQQEAMLAHELAHHHRRDPLWLAIGRWLEALFFFQPLNLLAGRRLRADAEILCDAWAVERTGERRALAECLARVAEWMLRPHVAVPASAMAQAGSALERRVRQLLEGDGSVGPARRRATRRWLLVLLPLLFVAAFAPAFGRPAATASIDAPPPSGDAKPLSDLAVALTALDDEVVALERELLALIELSARIEDPPAALTRGVKRLTGRLAALGADRTALVARIRMHMESNR